MGLEGEFTNAIAASPNAAGSSFCSGVAPALAGSVVLFYLTGTWSSARAGKLVQQIGHGKTLFASSLLFAVGIGLCAG